MAKDNKKIMNDLYNQIMEMEEEAIKDGEWEYLDQNEIITRNEDGEIVDEDGIIYRDIYAGMIGGDIYELLSLPKWSEDMFTIKYQLDTYNFTITKEEVIKNGSRTDYIIERLTLDAKKNNLILFNTCEELPFNNLFVSDMAVHIANYLLSCNTALSYDVIKSGGMNEFYVFIVDSAIEKMSAIRSNFKSNLDFVESDPLNIYVGYEYSMPLILDFDFLPFTYHNGIVPIIF